MVWGIIGLVLFLLVWGYKYLKPVANKTRGDNPIDLNSTTETSTVNSALENYLSSFKIYVVKYVNFADGQENVIQEKTYNTGTNNERLKRAEGFYKLTCQNISARHRMGNAPGEHEILVSLYSIETRDGFEKVTILKQTDSKPLNQCL